MAARKKTTESEDEMNGVVLTDEEIKPRPRGILKL